MKDVAQVAWKGGSVSLPIGTPYEREVLGDYVKRATETHGQVRLGMNKQEWVVSASHPQSLCSACSRPFNVVNVRRNRRLCASCARQEAAAGRRPLRRVPSPPKGPQRKLPPASQGGGEERNGGPHRLV